MADARGRSPRGPAGALVATGVALILTGSVVALRPPQDDLAAGRPTGAVEIPLVSSPPGWPRVVLEDPAEGYLPSPKPRTVEGPTVLASGTADGSPFTLYAWLQGAARQLCRGFVGPARPDRPVASSPGTHGCIREHPLKRWAERVALGHRGRRDDVLARFGSVGDRVFELWVETPGQEPVEVPFDEIGGTSIGWYLFFPPSEEGSIRVYGPAGRVAGSAIAKARFCDPGPRPGACRSTAGVLAP